MDYATLNRFLKIVSRSEIKRIAAYDMWNQRNGKTLCIVEERKSDDIQFAKSGVNESEMKLNNAYESRTLCVYELC